MRYLSDHVDYACECCERARQKKNGMWYCTVNSDYFPNAYWAEEDDESECPRFEPDYDTDEDW